MRYNIAPTQAVLAVVNECGPAYRTFSWGLIPSWSRDRSIAVKLINAREETIFEKPSFRAAAKRRRCLIPASGFFEWETPAKGPKLPHHFQMAGREPFAMAGLWEIWHDDQGSELDTCTIVTTFANDLVATYHERMPAIVAAPYFDAWLDPTVERSPEFATILSPFPARLMREEAVSPRMNSVRAEDPANLVPLTA